jgi:hypothetical protein
MSSRKPWTMAEAVPTRAPLTPPAIAAHARTTRRLDEAQRPRGFAAGAELGQRPSRWPATPTSPETPPSRIRAGRAGDWPTPRSLPYLRPSDLGAIVHLHGSTLAVSGIMTPPSRRTSPGCSRSSYSGLLPACGSGSRTAKGSSSAPSRTLPPIRSPLRPASIAPPAVPTG